MKTLFLLKTLNGQFIKKYAHDVESLDHLIQENQHAQECKIKSQSE